jgi:Alginate export
VKILIGLALEAALSAQCIVNNPGGSRVNPSRPSDADTPEATVSPLSALNASLPGWICFAAGYRARYEGGVSDSFLLARFRFGVAIKPVSWFKSYIELQNADAFWRTPPLAPPYQETWDLRRAYVEFGDIQEGHFGLRVGRQDLNFGDGRLIGTSYWRNASRGFDAVEAVTNWDWGNATAFAASQVAIHENGLSHHQAGNNLYGLAAKLSRIVPEGVVEPYLFWRIAPGNVDKKTVGTRISGSILRAWDYDTEGAWQTGDSWAWMAIAGYKFNRTRLFAEYDYASPAFDQLSPNVHDHFGTADQFAWQNLKAVRAGARFWILRNWTLAAAWNDFWLASARDPYYNSSGAVAARDATGRSGTHIAEEYDLETFYRLNRELELGAGVGRILPGEFLTRTGHGAYTYPFVMLNYNFF